VTQTLATDRLHGAQGACVGGVRPLGPRHRCCRHCLLLLLVVLLLAWVTRLRCCPGTCTLQMALPQPLARRRGCCSSLVPRHCVATLAHHNTLRHLLLLLVLLLLQGGGTW
jgi:hypothetical protein